MKYILTIFLIFLTLISSGQEVSSFKLSGCDSDSYVDLVRRRIVSKSIQNDTLLLKIGFVENCCIDPLPITKHSNDTIYLTMENVSETFCMCDCCFEIDISLLNVYDTNFVLIWENSIVKTQSKYPKLPHNYQIDENTPVNILNSDSLKIGLWHEESKSSGRKFELFYDLNPTDKEVLLWMRIYNENGEVESIAISKEPDGEFIEFDSYEYARAFEK